MRIVVDASVAVKWAVPEPDTDLALPLLDADLVVPDLFFPEIANVLWKKVQRGELTPPEADRAAALLLALEYDVSPTAPLLRAALDLACQTGYPTYDFHYVALARQHGLRFVTADTRLVRKLRDVRPIPAWAGQVVPLSEV